MEFTQKIETAATRLQNLEILNLEDKISLKVLGEKINELIVFANSLNVEKPAQISKSTKSEKVMSEDDARKAMIGEYKGLSHKECAEILGLSYGQIYSARKGFTFKPIYKEMTSAAKVE